MKAIVSTKQRYETDAVAALREICKTDNALALPRIERVVVHAGIGRISKEKAAVQEVVDAIAAITTQKPILTTARKSIAGFKIREGQPIGVMATLRGERMWSFLDRLIVTALPRVRDFQGIARTSVDTYGNLNIGIREHTVFPEIVPEKATRTFGLQVTVKTTARTREEGEALFRALGVPLQKDES